MRVSRDNATEPNCIRFPSFLLRDFNHDYHYFYPRQVASRLSTIAWAYYVPGREVSILMLIAQPSTRTALLIARYLA